MNTATKIFILGLTLAVTGCNHCGERWRPFQRLRERFDDDDDQDRRSPDSRRRTSTEVGGQQLSYNRSETGFGQPVITAPSVTIPYESFPTNPSYQTYPSFPVNPTYPTFPSGDPLPINPGSSPRVDELPPPGSYNPYAQPKPTDMGKSVIKGNGQTTGEARK